MDIRQRRSSSASEVESLSCRVVEQINNWTDLMPPKKMKVVSPILCNEVFVEVGSSRYPAKLSTLAAQSTYFAKIAKSCPSRVIKCNEDPRAFEVLYRYMVFNEFDAHASHSKSVLRLARKFGMKEFLDTVKPAKQFARLRLLDPKVEWLEDEEDLTFIDGRRLIVEIRYGNKFPYLTTLVDGMNWLHRNKYTTLEEKAGQRLKSSAGGTSHTASIMVSRPAYIDVHDWDKEDGDDADCAKQFALLSMAGIADAANIDCDSRGKNAKVTLAGSLKGKAVLACAVRTHCPNGEIEALNWLHVNNYKDEETNLTSFCNCVSAILIKHNLAPHNLDLRIWSRPIATNPQSLAD